MSRSLVLLIFALMTLAAPAKAGMLPDSKNRGCFNKVTQELLHPAVEKRSSLTEVNLREGNDTRYSMSATRSTEVRSAYPRSQPKLRELEAKYIALGENLIWKTPPGKIHKHLGFIPTDAAAAQSLVGKDIAGFSESHGGTEFSGHVIDIVQDTQHEGVYHATVSNSGGAHTTFPISGVRALWVKEGGGTVVEIVAESNKVIHDHPSQNLHIAAVRDAQLAVEQTKTAADLAGKQAEEKAVVAQKAQEQALAKKRAAELEALKVRLARVAQEKAAIRDAEQKAALAQAAQRAAAENATTQQALAELAAKKSARAVAAHDAAVAGVAHVFSAEKDPFPPAPPAAKPPAPLPPIERVQVTRNSKGVIMIAKGNLPPIEGREIHTHASVYVVPQPGKAGFEALQVAKSHGYRLVKIFGAGGTRDAYILEKDGQQFILKVINPEKLFPRESWDYPGAELHDFDWRKNPVLAKHPEKETEWRKVAEELAAKTLNREITISDNLDPRYFTPSRRIYYPWLTARGGTLQPFNPKGQLLSELLKKYPQLEKDPVVVKRKLGYKLLNPGWKRVGEEYYGMTMGYEGPNGEVVLEGIDMKPEALHPEERWGNTLADVWFDKDGEPHLHADEDFDL